MTRKEKYTTQTFERCVNLLNRKDCKKARELILKELTTRQLMIETKRTA